MTAAADDFLQFHSVLSVGNACLCLMEISSVFSKAPGVGGGGCVYKDAGDKQKIGKDEGEIVNMSSLHIISGKICSYFDSVIKKYISVIEEQKRTPKNLIISF